MTSMTFADVVHQAISFSKEDPAEALILKLIDSVWMQRLREISQTANTRLVYMFSEHSRFGHSLGVCFLAKTVLDKLAVNHSRDIARFRAPILCAALLHDVGHLAPGSHTAFKAWFPQLPDTHEELALRIITQDKALLQLLSDFDPQLPALVCKILSEDDTLPPWTWEIVSGGGWNVDRGNWCIVDSILAGVSYGQYNIPALLESMLITQDGHLGLRENRLDSMMHFVVSRHAMYRQIYQHRVILSADTLNRAIVQRARDVGSPYYADEIMQTALAAKSPQELSIDHILGMRESWWRYHLFQWQKGNDAVLADLSSRHLNRRLFKTVRLEEGSAATLKKSAEEAVRNSGYDPRYYLHEASTVDVHESDFRQSMPVLMEDGSIRHLAEADPLFAAMVREAKSYRKSWLAMPEEAKLLLGRDR